MNRKKFLSNAILGMGGIVTGVACQNNTSSENTIPNNNGSTDSTSSGTCSLTPTETKGPYPIKTPTELVKANIISDRAGVALMINLTIQNTTNCSPLSGYLVDVWHCDKDGNYSEYGNLTTVHFLRGRQTTDANGKVNFLSIYPGWYSGRAPHIHVEILSDTGVSKLITQIAFPETINNTVYSTSSLYTKGLADTSNTRDNIFSDSLSSELATLSGNINDGFLLTHKININI